MQRSNHSSSFKRRSWALTRLLLTLLGELGLDPAHIVGQGYDGAGSVSGKACSVQARIAAQFPAAVYVHCRNHALNLPIVHSTKVRDVRNCLDTVQEIVSFITATPKRLQCFMANNRNKKWLQKFSDTCWSQHDSCMSSCMFCQWSLWGHFNHDGWI